VARRVHIATPTTLISLLRTAQYAWQQEALTENARAVFEAGRQLYERISGLGQHMDRVGKALTGAVAAYNQTVGSLESRVLTSARRLVQLGLVEDTQEAPRIVEDIPRLLSAPELTASVVPAAETTPSELTSAAPAPTGEQATTPPPELTRAATAAPSDPTEAAAPGDSPAELFMAHSNGTAT
jgi:DNA recombination protein RmuC